MRLTPEKTPGILPQAQSNFPRFFQLAAKLYF